MRLGDGDEDEDEGLMSMPIPLRFRGKQENMLIWGLDVGDPGDVGYLFSKMEIGEVLRAEFWFAKTGVGW
jgi:hypothetical protein